MKTPEELINNIEKKSDILYNNGLYILERVFRLKNLASEVYTMCEDSDSKLAEFSREVYLIVSSLRDDVDYIISNSIQLNYCFKHLMSDICKTK